MPVTTANTQRLALQCFEPSDATALFSFMSDASAMRHTYVAQSLGQCRARLQAYEAMRGTLGFAPWVVRTRRDGEIIGWGGLSLDPEEPGWGLEVSYALAPAAWGQGYATELVKASLGVAFGVLSAPEVHAFARPENGASVRVLQKSGFELLRYEHRLERNHYLVNRAGAA